LPPVVGLEVDDAETFVAGTGDDRSGDGWDTISGPEMTVILG